ncbi:polymer-forming cytoskeletal protein [Acidobacteriota bacterium]
MMNFEKKVREKFESGIKEKNMASSHIGSSFTLKGELSGNEDLIIEGNFQGNIDLKYHHLTVESQGKIEADIHAKNLTIRGKVEGKVCASGKVCIEKNSQMTGDISATSLAIMDGAQYMGNIKMAPKNK